MRSSPFFKSISLILILAMLHLYWLTSYGWAEIVPTESASQSHVQDDRQRLLDLLDRQEVIDELEKYGVTNVEAVARVNSLSDEEVAALVGEMDRLHAGGNQALALVLAAAIMVALYVPGLVFKAIYCIFASTACEKKGGAEWVFTFWIEDLYYYSKEESVNPEIQCYSYCHSNYHSCINSTEEGSTPEIQCEEEKQACFQQCEGENVEEDCDPGMESCPGI